MTSEERTASVVWIDADKATVWRWHDGEDSLLQRLVSEVPAHHKSTGHIGEAGGERHGGSGPRSGQEGHRREHLRVFLSQVERILPPDDDLLLLGDGVVVEYLAVRLHSDNVKHRRERRLEVAHSGPLSDPQLVARLRAFAGDPAPRRLPRR